MDASAVPADLQAAFDGERKAARALDVSNAAAARVHTVRMYGRIAELQTATAAQHRVGFACKRGCSYCCHLRVEIRPHDAFVLAHHVATKLRDDQRARVVARIDGNRRRIAALTPAEHVRAGIACALLEDGACLAYEARPATCRKYHSLSVTVCRNAFDDTTAPLTGDIEHEAVRLAGNAIALGYAKGLEDAGYDVSLYELHDALHRALNDPKAEKRYQRGKRAFVR